MSLLDLTSDLSKFRSVFSKEGSSSPEASSATDRKNFATFQPITEKLKTFNLPINKMKPVDHTKMLDRTSMDNIRPFDTNDVLVNAISNYSPVANNASTRNVNVAGVDLVKSKMPTINKFEFSSKLTKSNIQITKTEFVDDATSDVLITKPQQSFERKSTIILRSTRLTDDKTSSTPSINTTKISGVVIDPGTPINRVSQTGEYTSVDLFNTTTPTGNIVDPNVSPLPFQNSTDREGQTPQIMTDTIKEGLVVNPNTKIFKVQNGEAHLGATSKLDPLGKPLRFVVESKIEDDVPGNYITGIKYDSTTIFVGDTSGLNLDKAIYTIPYGRHENTDNTRLAPKGILGVNFFSNEKVNGFTVYSKDSDIVGNSQFGWAGKSQSAPAVNFMTDTNGRGFVTFARHGETKFVLDSSKFGFKNPTGVDFFDGAKKWASKGFEVFTTHLDTKFKVGASQYGNIGEVNYFDVGTKWTIDGFTRFTLPLVTLFKTDSSIFTWLGKSSSAPSVNYFDGGSRYTTTGFHTFAQMYDTKFKLGSSIYDWDGNREEAPSGNYFDVSATNTVAGFHTFARLYDSKYIMDSSNYNWDGTREQAPEVNYFDLTGAHTTIGFHKFAQLYDTKYIPESSIYDWDGTKEQAPEVNYFDLTGRHTTIGFHKFAQLYDTKYIPESSIYDWDGTREQAPEVNYFDLTGRHTTIGFHKFAQLYDTKYVPESSIYDWDGSPQQAPEVNYFDLTGKHTTKGFHRFAQMLDTKYVHESSRFDWDGNRYSAPETDYFDLTRRHTTKGFHRFAQLYDTKYVKDSSIFDWDGNREAAPVTNFFQDDKNSGFTKFVRHLDSEYKRDVSAFVFKGALPSPVDFFTDFNARGFENKIQLLDSKYFNDTSGFVFKGSAQNAPSANYFVDNVARGFTKFIPHLQTEYKTDVSRFTFKGSAQSAPEVDFLLNLPADGYSKFTPYLLSRYKQSVSKYTWSGGREQAPEVNYFGIGWSDPNAISGFTRLFNDKGSTKYSDMYSSFSVGSSNKKIGGKPYTDFFGFNPSERTGFMPNMTTFNGTLYPVIDPTLRFNDNPEKRYEIESARQQRKRLSTVDTYKYAPNSLGPRPWVDGTLFSTLENQIPDMILDGNPGSYTKKYERTMKDGTNNLGYLTKWAITRRSPSQLDLQYEKFHLRNESYNRDPIWSQPFVVRGIQSEGMVENERWGGFAGGFDDGIVRGGVATQAERILYDEQRIGKFLSSGKGLLWIAKQAGLQLMNPVVDVDPNTPTSGVLGLSATLIFNPLSIVANVATARAGFHIARHGIVSFDSNYLNKYEVATINREMNLRLLSPFARRFDSLETPTEINRQTSYNRLIGLMKELLPNSFKPNKTTTPTQIGPPSPFEEGVKLLRELTGKNGIVRISSNVGGPQSMLGIGGTQIRRARHPYLTHYTTAPNLSVSNTTSVSQLNQFVGPLLQNGNISQLEPQYPDSAKRDVHYATFETYSDRLKGSGFLSSLKGISYTMGGAKELNDIDQLAYVDGVQLGVITKIENLDPFDPKYENQVDRLQAKDANNSKRVGSSLADGPSDKLVDADLPIKRYKVANYQNLKRNDRRGSKYYNDFRANIELDETTKGFIGNPDAARYDTRNLEERYGFGFQGDPGSQRDIPFISNVGYKKFDKKEVFDASGPAAFRDYAVSSEKVIDGKKTKFRGDRINIIDYKRANFNINTNLVYEKGQYTDGIKGTDDLIEFYFSSLVLSGHNNCPAEVIVFRATFGNITDNHQPSWNSVKYMGRADPLYVYQGYEREISFDFTVHISSRDEMKASWRKLNYLASWTAPEYLSSGQMRGPMVRLNIGHLYRKMPGYISSLSYTFDNTQTTWETARLPEDMNLDNAATSVYSNPGVLQLPKHINVNVSFVPVGVYRPEFRGIMYSLYDDKAESSNGIETGLQPLHQNKVNYFKEFDDLEGTPTIYSGVDVTIPDKPLNEREYGAAPIQTISSEPTPNG